MQKLLSVGSPAYCMWRMSEQCWVILFSPFFRRKIPIFDDDADFTRCVALRYRLCYEDTNTRSEPRSAALPHARTEREPAKRCQQRARSAPCIVLEARHNLACVRSSSRTLARNVVAG